MITRTVKIDKEKIDEKIIQEASQIIKEGGLVAFPTETVYGLGADALNKEGAKRTYAAKGRPSDNPLIVHIAEFEALSYIVSQVPEDAKTLGEKFWPGPLTMILPKSDVVPLEATGGLDTVAVRMPDHKIALAFIKAAGGYVTGPSANTSGKPSPTLAEHVAHDLDGKIPMILDGGAGNIGIESTIVDVTGEVPMILRPGYISKEMLEEALGKEVCIDPGIIEADSKERPKAPGMKYKHYAPKADLVIVKGDSEKVIETINAFTKENQEKGLKTGVIGTDETVSKYTAEQRISIGSREDELEISRRLYGILRDFDTLEVDRIYSESFDTPNMGQAIMNRLLKAAGHHVLEVQEEA